MRPLAVFIALALIVTSICTADAKYLHCYEGDAPDGVQAGPQEFQKKLMFLEFGLVITLYRKACELTDETDRQYVRALYGQAGCTAKSDVGQTFDRVLEADISEIEGFADFEVLRAEHTEYVAEFCALVQDTPWPVYRPDFTPLSPELYSAYRKALDEIRAHKERFIAERNGGRK